MSNFPQVAWPRDIPEQHLNQVYVSDSSLSSFHFKYYPEGFDLKSSIIFR